MHALRDALLLITLSLLPCVAAGCASQRIAVAEAFGYAKREQLVDRVQDARDEQLEAKQQFESALAEFLAVTGAQTGELEDRYKKLNKEYERSEDAAADVRSRIDAVERVAEALFDEWNDELEQYTSPTLRRSSEQQLKDTQRQYQKLIGAMQAAEQKMDPVLLAFKDQVLFLKHNLNARAIAALQGSVDQIQSDVGRLIKEMEASIAEANTFIEEMKAAAPAA